MMVTDNKDDYILHLHEQQMNAPDRKTALLYRMIKEFGLSWQEILQEGLNEQSTSREKFEFFADFGVASTNLIAWMMIALVHPYVPSEAVKGGFDALLADLNTKLYGSLPSLKKMGQGPMNSPTEGIDPSA